MLGFYKGEKKENMKNTHIDNKVLIREFNEDRDIEMVERLERNCEIESRKGMSIYTNMMGDPLCRIRFYPFHVLLVAEMVENGEIVGVVRGCIKYVGTGFEGTHVKVGCILGLRVSPKHRRKGIGLKLVNSIEDWSVRNGAQYLFAAAEAKNIASINLFVLKCNYAKLRSLVIFMQPVHSRAKDPASPNIRIEKLSIEQAISLYKNRLGSNEFFPLDIESILNEKLSLGTWVSFFKQEGWIGLDEKERNEDFINGTPSSWAILSIWKTCEAYKLQIRRQHPFKCFHATLSHARGKVFPCLRIRICDFLHRPFGFLFLYGIHAEGERFGELMKSLWCFAYNLARNVKDCKVMITEFGDCDPVREHVPKGTSMSCINDLWFLKKVRCGNSDEEEEMDSWPRTEDIKNVFVDPRDF